MEDETSEMNESKKWRQALIDSALDATVVIDEMGIILDFNSSAEKLFGFQKAAITGKKMASLIVPLEMRESHNQGLERLRVSGIGRILGQRLEVSARRSDGSEFQIELVVNRVDLSPSPVYVGTIRDVSDQKQNEENLRSSEMQFRAIADSAPVMIWLAGFDGAISWFNRVWLDFTGCSMEDSCGFGWIDSVHPEDVEELLQVYHASLDARTGFSTEFRLRRKSGDYHWVLANIAPTFSPDGSLVGYAASVIDINTRHLAEEALLLTRFALDRAGDGVFLINEDSSLHYVNDSACQLLGYSQAELLKLGVCDISSEMISSQWPQHWEKVKKLKRFNRDAFYQKKDGTKFPVEISLDYIEFQGRELCCSVARDVTEQHISKQALTNALNDARAASQAKSEFLAIVSHEMRTPLNGVLGMAELLLKTHVTDDQSELLKVCQQSGTQLKQLIDDLLDFSLFQQGRFELQPKVFELRGLLDRLRDSFQDRVTEKDLEFRWEVAQEVPERIFGDARRLYQIIENFLSNAIKFTNQGSISFRATVENSQSGQTTLGFSVEDTGIGVKSEDQKRIFHKFEQVDTSSTRSHRGIGLGLAICRALVKQMNGQIGVKPGNSGGSCFYFKAPFLVHKTEAKKMVNSKDPVRKLNSGDCFADLNVMLVEDDPPSQLVAKLILEQLGIVVTTAFDGHDAVEKFEKTPGQFEVVFMDITMPRLDGINAMNQIRKKTRTGVPFIAMTAQALKGDREWLLDEGFDEYIAKPISQAAIITALSSVLSKEITESVDAAERQPRSQVVDLVKLRSHCDNDPELLAELVARFGETCDESFKRISNGLAESNIDVVIDAAHRLRGSIGSMCAISALELADRFEITARSSDVSKLKEELPQLISVIDELRRIFKEHFG